MYVQHVARLEQIRNITFQNTGCDGVDFIRLIQAVVDMVMNIRVT
jgi:hypothetical protein